jgi:hypothetical protein
MNEHAVLQQMIERALTITILGKGPEGMPRKLFFQHVINPLLPIGKPVPSGQPEQVWMVFIEGHSYLRRGNSKRAAYFETFADAYAAALAAKLVPPLT